MADRAEGQTYSNTGGTHRWMADSPNPETVKEATYNADAHRGGAVTFNAHTNTVERQGTRTVQMDERSGSDPLDSARDGKFKSPIPRAALKGDSLIRINGIEGDLDGFVRIGAVQKMADGSYRMAGTSDRPFDQPREAGEQQNQPAPKQQEPQEASERLDQETEATIGAAVEKLGAQQVSALFEHTARGNDVAKLMPEIASRLGMESEQAVAAYERTVSSFRAQAQAAAATAGVDADAWDDFCEWARTQRPNEKHKAESVHFEHGRTGGIRALAKEYATSGRQFSDTDLLAADFGPGVKVWKDDANGGRVILSAHGQTMPLRQAIQTGVVRISRKR